jgi:choline dehydrogenase-like flavoprotein
VSRIPSYDIIIIGTGMGGGTLAYALRHSGARILLLERGDYLPQEEENWQPKAVFSEKRYKPQESWRDAEGQSFQPGVHYFVGGNTKVYGAALPRLRSEDFEVLEHEDGTSPMWPISYQELEPYYARAEVLYRVHGQAGVDPTEPSRSGAYPFPAVPNEGYIETLAGRLRGQDLHPYPLPMGIDLREGGRCIRCKTCDGFPCKVLAKSDADTCCVRPALESPEVELWPRCYARRLLTDASGKRVRAVEVDREGETLELRAERFIVSCGEVNSAALLLRSTSSAHPNGLGNKSDLIGRNYMVHNNTALMAIKPWQVNGTVFQKTLAVNDYYLKGSDSPYPLGNIQLLGKLQAGMLAAARPLMPQTLLQKLANRSVDWWVMSEDLPEAENRITLTSDGAIEVRWRANNTTSHKRLVETAKTVMRRAGFPLIFTQTMGIETNSHQCGTLRFGEDPATSAMRLITYTWSTPPFSLPQVPPTPRSPSPHRHSG